MATFGRVRPRDLIPVTPAIAEPSTGETMGQSAEKMAKENGISREEQDQLALRSHQRAAAATADGRLTAEIAPWFGGPEMDQVITADNGVRSDTSLDALAKLKPVFDRRYGTVTAGNSSPLTDGAAAVLLMAEEKAKALGHEPLAYIRSYAVSAVDPGWQLLMGPVFAVPKALERAELAWSELGLVEIHEAFAAQVLSNVQAWGSQAWADRLGLPAPVGEVDWDRTNVAGGSIAIGHPFAATGARLVTTLANEMRRRDVQFGLISICAQGGMGYAMVLERRWITSRESGVGSRESTFSRSSGCRRRSRLAQLTRLLDSRLLDYTMSAFTTKHRKRHRRRHLRSAGRAGQQAQRRGEVGDRVAAVAAARTMPRCAPSC